MPNGAFGIRRLLDSQQRFAMPGLPMYLRQKNFTDNPAITELGFEFTPTTPTVHKGVRDTQIRPQPTIKLMSMHSIAMAQAAGVQLLIGARKVTISHTWVLQQQRINGYANASSVFNDASVVGIVTDNLLLQVASATHDDAFGEPIEWYVLCNCADISGA